MYDDEKILNEIILGEINRKERPSEVLFLFNYKSNLLNELLEKTTAKITLLSSDILISSERIDKWAEDPFKFIDLSIETRTRFDFILIINPEEYFAGKESETFNLKEIHKEMMRNLQRNLLKESGIIIFETHQEGFTLNEYIKPGADKLTKKVLNEEERATSKLQAYAFYA